MSNQFVTYKVAKQLKEIGFDEPCLYCFDSTGMRCSHAKDVFDYMNYNAPVGGGYVSQPSYDDVFEWFKKKHKIVVTICYCIGNVVDRSLYSWYIVKDFNALGDIDSRGKHHNVFFTASDYTKEQSIITAIELVREKL